MTVGRISSSSAAARRDAEPLSPWLRRHAAVMLAALGATVWVPHGAWLTLAAAGSFADLLYRERARLLQPYGYANQLTVLRLGVLLAAAALMNELPSPWLWLLFAANVVADVADGYVARRTHQVSAFGAVLDREVDAVFVLVAYVYFFVVAGLPAWVLIPGLLPYVYRIAMFVRRDQSAPEHRERLAPFLAGANFVVLLIAVGAPVELQRPVVLLSITIVGVSFLVSFANLYSDEHSAT
jgi:phosphatidylserine synthase